MNLDQLARDATQELLEVVATPSGKRRFDLERRRRRRTVARGVALLGAAALVAAAWGVTAPAGPESDRGPQPAGPEGLGRNGALVTVVDRSVVVLDGELPDAAPRSVRRWSRVDFTRDGTRMMVHENDGSLHLVDVTTGGSTPLGACALDACDADLSPAGDAVALTSQEEPRIELRPVEGSESEHVITPDVRPYSPSWSPDGSRIAFNASEGLFVIDRDGEGMRVIRPSRTRSPAIDARLLPPPSWSPDGTRLAVMQVTPLSVGGASPGLVPLRFTLIVLGVHSGTTQMTRDVGSCYCVGLPAPTATWSPDGSLIAVSTVRNPKGRDITDARGNGVYVVRPDGSDWRLLTKSSVGTSLTWQPLLDSGGG